MRRVILGSVLMLAACSGQQGGGNATANGASASGGTTASATASSLNLTDACAALPRERVAEAFGQTVQTAELKDVMTDTGNGMSSSRCVYDLGDIRLITLNLERFPNGADMTAIFTGTRSLVSKNGAEPVEDVPGLGERAFWVAGSKDLYIMLDDNRQIVLSTARLPETVDSKPALISLARTILG